MSVRRIGSGSGGPGGEGPAESDADLARRSTVEGEAFGVLYDRYCQQIYRFVHRRLPDRDTAEDVTAEVFFKALRSIGSYKPDVGEFLPWLYRIAGNAVIDYARAHKVVLGLEAVEDSTDTAAAVDDQVINRVELARVWEAIETLPHAQRTAVMLRYERDLPIADIAQRMGRSAGAVKLLLNRALAAVRRRVSPAESASGAIDDGDRP